MGDWEVAAYVRQEEDRIKKAYERGQRILRGEILRLISASKRDSVSIVAANAALDALVQDIVAMPLPLERDPREAAKDAGEG